jgi:hypothetical protein
MAAARSPSALDREKIGFSKCTPGKARFWPTSNPSTGINLVFTDGLNRRIDPLPPDNAFSPAMTDDLSRRAGQPTHEALWPADLFTQGIGWVITARFKLEGARVQAGIFLIDVFCLGAKLAVYEDCDGDDYRRRIRDHYPVFPWSRPNRGAHANSWSKLSSTLRA